jgi:taurine dioxygenase
VATTLISVSPTTGAIGAVVDGVDLHAPLDDPTAQRLRDALDEHSVLFFHDQDLSEDEQLAFARTFGTVGQYPLAKLFGSTAFTSTIEDTADSPPDADGWHTDITWVAEPPAYAFLNAKVIPDRGGDTMWASLFAAYDALSPVMQELCCQLTVRHHAGPDFHERVSRNAGEEMAAKIIAEFPPVEHPLVRTHPVTGRRALFVAGRFMDQIVGMHRDESDALLDYLQRHVENPNFCVRWRWTEGDLAVWDEAATNHRALSDHYPAHRVMRRCTVDGGRPFFTP